MENLGERIRTLRKEKALSQPELAKIVGVSNGVISFWENDLNEPKASYLKVLADCFDISTDYLLGRTDDFGNVSVQSSVPQLSEESFDKKICGGHEMLFSQRLKELRNECGLTQKELAKKLKTTDKSIWNYEKGIARPPIEIITAYADFFQVSTDYLLGRTDDFGNVFVQSSVPQLSEDSFDKKICGGNEMPFSQRLKELRNECGLTQKKIASIINVSQQCYSDYENGKTAPDLITLSRLANFLNTTVDYLLGRTDDFGNVSVQTAAPALSEEETEILNAFRTMTYSQRIRFAAYAEGMLENTTKKKA